MTRDFTRKPTRLVLLDRDGVINYDSVNYVKSLAEWRPIPGSLAAIAKLNSAGIYTALCSNQAGISRGKLTARSLAEIHRGFSLELAKENGRIDLWRYCPHHPDDKCLCRKPNSAMLEDCMQELQVSADKTLFIGDSLKDMQAALRANCGPVLVRSSQKSEQQEIDQRAKELGVKVIVDTLTEAVDLVLHANARVSEQ